MSAYDFAKNTGRSTNSEISKKTLFGSFGSPLINAYTFFQIQFGTEGRKFPNRLHVSDSYILLEEQPQSFLLDYEHDLERNLILNLHHSKQLFFFTQNVLSSFTMYTLWMKTLF